MNRNGIAHAWTPLTPPEEPVQIRRALDGLMQEHKVTEQSICARCGRERRTIALLSDTGRQKSKGWQERPEGGDWGYGIEWCQVSKPPVPSYAFREVFKPEEVEQFARISARVNAIRSYNQADLRSGFEGEVRCHELARAVARIWRTLDVIDGKYGLVEHSWLVDPRFRCHVIDTYVPGALPQVQLIDVSPLGIPNRYHPGPNRTDIRLDIVEALCNRMNPK